MSNSIYSQDHKYLIEQLKKARKEAGLGQVEIAKKLKKSQSYISKIESGQRRIDVLQLKQFAKLYKKVLNYLVSDFIQSAYSLLDSTFIFMIQGILYG